MKVGHTPAEGLLPSPGSIGKFLFRRRYSTLYILSPAGLGRLARGFKSLPVGVAAVVPSQAAEGAARQKSNMATMSCQIEHNVLNMFLSPPMSLDRGLCGFSAQPPCLERGVAYSASAAQLPRPLASRLGAPAGAGRRLGASVSVQRRASWTTVARKIRRKALERLIPRPGSIDFGGWSTPGPRGDRPPPGF